MGTMNVEVRNQWILMQLSAFFTSCLGMDKILVCVEGYIDYSWHFLGLTSHTPFSNVAFIFFRIAIVTFSPGNAGFILDLFLEGWWWCLQ